MNIIKVSPLEDPNISRPIWSVMIPAHNCENYLRQAIQNVLVQDKGAEDMEIWVVDDCSIKNPQHLVDQLGKGR